jgi:alkanesulfonate monooxygenase SsuD/methylene tetrahydromethanopterin reductase-like flavin-dependent oxidoreductase (luciferase family)
MRYGISISPAGPAGDPRTMAGLAAEAEQAGWDGVFLEDYIVYQGQTGTPTYDPWVTMAAMATATSSIRIGAGVTPLPRRRPWKLAAETVTLDHLSGGRLILGVGSGDVNDPGFGAAGEPGSRPILSPGRSSWMRGWRSSPGYGPARTSPSAVATTRSTA